MEPIKPHSHCQTEQASSVQLELEMWANAQRDGRPAEYCWRPLCNEAKFE